MTTAEKCSLRWTDFQENIISAFSNLRDDTNLTDVTLLTEDGQNLEAHKLILSASSPFFMNILKMNKHPNPLVYLKGFKATYISSILDLMYHGVVDIYQDNLDVFLALAEELQQKVQKKNQKTTKRQRGYSFQKTILLKWQTHITCIPTTKWKYIMMEEVISSKIALL